MFRLEICLDCTGWMNCVGLLLSCGNVASESYGSALAGSLKLFISHSHNKRWTNVSRITELLKVQLKFKVTELTLSRGAQTQSRDKKTILLPCFFFFWQQLLFSTVQMCKPDGHDHANGFNEAINMQRVCDWERFAVRHRLIFTCQNLEGSRRIKL